MTNPGPRPVRRSTIGRLLHAISKTDEQGLTRLATTLNVSMELLVRYRDEQLPLDPAVQMAVAAIALAEMPQHASLANKAYAQAQTALRLQAGEVEGRMVYPRTFWR